MTNQSWSWTPTNNRVNSFAAWSAALALVLPPVAFIFAVVSLRRIRRSGERGQELAIAALMISVALIVGAALVAVTYVIH